MMLGNVRSDEGDSNQNVKKAIGMIKKTTNLPIHSHFTTLTRKCLISRFTGDANNYRRNFLCLSELGCGSKEFNSRRV